MERWQDRDIPPEERDERPGRYEDAGDEIEYEDRYYEKKYGE